MPIQCHTLNKAASKQFSFELAPKRDCVGLVDVVTHTSTCMYVYCMLTHTNICTSICTYVCTWERRRIEMKAKVAFVWPTTKSGTEEHNIISEESKKLKLTQQNSREKSAWNWEYMFGYVCLCLWMPIAAHKCICIEPVAIWLQLARGHRRSTHL